MRQVIIDLALVRFHNITLPWRRIKLRIPTLRIDIIRQHSLMVHSRVFLLNQPRSRRCVLLRILVIFLLSLVENFRIAFGLVLLLLAVRKQLFSHFVEFSVDFLQLLVEVPRPWTSAWIVDRTAC